MKAEMEEKPRKEWTYGMAAKKLGITEQAYRARICAGEKWCTNCKTWHKREAFGLDKARRDKLTQSCLASYVAKYVPRPRQPPGPRRPYRCSVCEGEDHNKTRCPERQARSA